MEEVLRQLIKKAVVQILNLDIKPVYTYLSNQDKEG